MIFQKFFFESLDSTNDYLELIAKDNNSEEGIVIVTKQQTKGRGQGNNFWFSENGGLYFSLLLKPEKYLPLLSILTGIVVSETLEQVSENKFMIKWANDVLYENKKIAGILVESRFKGNIPEYFIIGCGININQSEMPSINNNYQATSLKMIDNKEFELNNILDIFLNRFINLYNEYLSGNSHIIIDKFTKKMYLKNKIVKVSTYGNKIIEGVITGINSDGALILSINNKDEIIYSGKIIL